jgi:hypothetical protein
MERSLRLLDNNLNEARTNTNQNLTVGNIASFVVVSGMSSSMLKSLASDIDRHWSESNSVCDPGLATAMAVADSFHGLVVSAIHSFDQNFQSGTNLSSDGFSDE